MFLKCESKIAHDRQRQPQKLNIRTLWSCKVKKTQSILTYFGSLIMTNSQQATNN